VKVIDLRSLHYPPPGVSSFGQETLRSGTTMFIRRLACGECLSQRMDVVDGVRYCSGCNRRVTYVEGDDTR